MQLTGYDIEMKHTVLLQWGALRGALGMFLSLILMNKENIDRQISTTILFHTSFIALLTLTINGLTTGTIVQKLGLSRETGISKKFMWMFLERVTKLSIEKQDEFTQRARQ
jgi:NhaP-type Na+/H+ or K+/H+ antiporter